MATSALNFEEERAKKIAENRRRMEEMGLLKQAKILDTFRVVKKDAPVHKPIIRKVRGPKLPVQARRSGRLSGQDASYLEIDEHDRPIGVATQEIARSEEGLVDLMDRRGYVNERNQMIVPPEPSQEALQAIQEVRCSSQGRGSVYDSSAGITCHFCRQKKLCGEEGCPRCSKRDVNLPCIGKSECARCMGATGRFCRACLLIRYGQRLEDVKVQEAAGTWLCPHCYEDEHPDEGWICNSSICMTRRGLKPTGIAIYDAQERGYKSVAHLLQAKLKKDGPTKILNKAAGITGDDNNTLDATITTSTITEACPSLAHQPTNAASAAEETHDVAEVDMKTRLARVRKGKANAAANADGTETQEQSGQGGVPAKGRGRPPRAQPHGSRRSSRLA